MRWVRVRVGANRHFMFSVPIFLPRSVGKSDALMPPAPAAIHPSSLRIHSIEDNRHAAGWWVCQVIGSFPTSHQAVKKTRRGGFSRDGDDPLQLDYEEEWME